ncbi:hypothetical protein SAMN05192588_1794 [Nonlabens sp. Hel1_33_55]|uniref:hypothetical protein n=1 Tax=Nonlabens sp. Hel1_33_55 TaxID=1336802 RepID=UPI000875F069|nr:hypothetical protein [Nonlabens sp. Hel1_33_55]SCY23280.1 hypothetical protein SAMN05192588_1794 [Nonlabens sp. Hel1_33_55]
MLYNTYLRNYYLTVLLLIPAFTFSQVGIGTVSPDPSSILDLSGSNKGFLGPRVALTDVTNASIDDIVPNAEGLMVYNTNPSIINGSGKGYYVWDGNAWTSLIATVTAQTLAGDIKNGFQPTDHNGWYLLDGRPVTNLPNDARLSAVSLGFVNNLPNATNRILKARNTGETLGATSGNSTGNEVTLTANQIPALTGSTDNSGAHDHQYGDEAADLYRMWFRSGSNFNAFVSNGNYTDLPRNTESSGAHNHQVTVNSGTSNAAVSISQASIVTNVFVYLGS